MRYVSVLAAWSIVTASLLGQDAAKAPAKPAAQESPEKAKAAPQPKAVSDTEIASNVFGVFKAKCGQCHSSGKKFGYILDLKRVASTKRIVVPFKPDESKLWDQVDSDMMPPEDAKAGPLTKEEKEVIHTWIATGAPAPEGIGIPSKPDITVATSSSDETDDRPFLKRAFFFSGRFHVIVVHFPIALIMAAAAGEVWFWWLGSQGVHPAVRFSTDLAALAGVPAAALGWVLSWTGAGSDQLYILFLHQWVGTAAAGLLVVIALATEADARRSTRSLVARLLLFGGAAVVGLAGHLGGLLVHGENYFTW
jgi:hypothetical protein